MKVVYSTQYKGENKLNKIRTIFIWVFGTLFVISFMLYMFLGMVSSGDVEVIEYPNGNLSDSLFVSQNTEYVNSDSLPIQYDFKKTPYSVDLVDSPAADVDTGHIVNIDDNYYIYIAEYPHGENIHDIVLNQYPKAVYYNYSREASFSQTVREEYGFYNGFETDYFVDHLLVSTGTTTSARSAYVIGYAFMSGNDSEGEQYDNDIIIAVATTVESTDSFKNCKSILDSVAMTCRYDKDTAEKIARDRKEAKELALKQEQELTKQTLEQEKTRVEGSPKLDTFDLPVNVNNDYKSLTILMTWTNNVSNPSIVFTNQSTGSSVSPDTLLGTQAILRVGSVSKNDTCILSVDNYKSYGTVNLKLLEE